MRLASQKDQKIIAGAMTNGAQTSVNFLSSIANRECIAFGEALKTPMRFTFESISRELLPGRDIAEVQEATRSGRQVDLATVIRRMRESERRMPTGEEALVAQAPATLPQREFTADLSEALQPAGRFAAAARGAPPRPVVEDALDLSGPPPGGTGAEPRGEAQRQSAASLVNAFRLRN